jgi:hypothetical protein
MLNDSPLAEFSPTFFGFASQGVTSKAALVCSSRFHDSHEPMSASSTSGLLDKQ